MAFAQTPATSTATETADAGAGGTGSGGASTGGAASVGGAPNALPESIAERVEDLERRARHIRELIARKLEPSINPDELFQPDPLLLTDDDAVQAEVARIRLSLPDAASEAPTSTDTSTSSATATDTGTQTDTATSTGADVDLTPAQRALVDALIDFEQAKLDFLSLPRNEREAILADHEARRVAFDAKQAESEQKLSDAQRRADDAAEEKARAQEELERAKTEAARSASEARVALLGLLEDHAAVESTFLSSEAAREEIRERGVALKRRASEIVKRFDAAEKVSGEADALYDEVTGHLRTDARPELDRLLSEVFDGADAPRPEPLALDPGVGDATRKEIEELHARVVKSADALDERLANERWARASSWAEHVSALDDARLSLLRPIDAAKRRDITGFTPAGLTQADAELFQIRLRLRYRFLAATQLVRKIRNGTLETSLFSTVAVVEILGLLLLFAWWRRRAVKATESLRTWADAPLVGVVKPHTAMLRRAVIIILRIRASLEWLLLVVVASSLLPDALRTMLEVRLPYLALAWIIGGNFAVAVVDALFARSARASETAGLRLRTFRLIGRVVTTFGLVLAVSAELVGKGTIHDWVWSVCWFAAIPVGLVIVRWWRAVIFTRVEQRSRKNRLARWVANNQKGIAAFPAAAVGGVLLLATELGRLLRGYVTGFETTRRLLAYLFRREMTQRRLEKEDERELGFPEASLLEALDPDIPSPPDTIVTRPIAAIEKSLREIVEASSGSVVALVGERGSGKSTLLKRLRADLSEPAIVIEMTSDDASSVEKALVAELGKDWKKRLEQESHTIIVDDAHRLITPAIGGLAKLDQVLGLARSTARTASWIIGFGAGGFRFWERARGARPAFDRVFTLRPFDEEEVADLVKLRAKAFDLDLHFDELVAEPDAVDELDRQEQLERAALNYYRLLWDYSAGNPLVALYYFRESLRSLDGEMKMVVFSQPEVDDLEGMPDNFTFALRAVLHLEPCTFTRIAAATRLPERVVDEAMRYATKKEYVHVDKHERYTIRTQWLRAIVDLLRRRHLIGKAAA